MEVIAFAAKETTKPTTSVVGFSLVGTEVGTRMRRLANVNPRLLVESLILLVIVRIAIPLRGVGATFRMASKVARLGRRSTRRNAEALPPEDLWLAVNRIAERFPLATTCVPRSIALWVMLRRRGIPAEMRIGVSDGSAGFASHAWVEISGEPVGETKSSLESFLPLAIEDFLISG